MRQHNSKIQRFNGRPPSNAQMHEAQAKLHWEDRQTSTKREAQTVLVPEQVAKAFQPWTRKNETSHQPSATSHTGKDPAPPLNFSLLAER